ncbi:MAG: cobaltochelatase subunit CobN [Rhodospirillales bacterium]|nr:cobaltochelatase subunit CobN [Rhodospirillales bacterium]
MHLLATEPGEISDGTGARDLGQTPGKIVFLSAADTEIALITSARAALGDDFPSVRAANLLALAHNLSVDLYADQVLARAKLIVVRLLGGRSYWPYGIERTLEAARAGGGRVAFLPGGDEPDAELARLSTVAREDQHRLWQYLVQGGAANAVEFLRFAAHLTGHETEFLEPRPLPRAGVYVPGFGAGDLEQAKARWQLARPLAALVVYRALVQAGDTEAVDAMCSALEGAGLNPLPLYAASLRDPLASATVGQILKTHPPDVVLAATSFSATGPDGAPPFAELDCPVLQVVFATETRASWEAGTRGLHPRDLAMNVALPEVDGRILTRAVAFKGEPARDPLTEADVRRLVPDPNRCAFVAAQAAALARLRRTPPERRRIALVLANYPNRDGRAANGVGLDTPASALGILRALAETGVATGEIPWSGDDLMRRLLAGPVNGNPRRPETESLSLADYQAFAARLAPPFRRAVFERWGEPESDPFYRPGETDCGKFAISALRFGNVAVAIQPARGYNLDPVASYHDPSLPPPHNYLAFYAWLREEFRADAVVHVGKHGNLEWLPGKALALSEACAPEAAFGPLPHVYPFIVNDPGEGAQAKRRASAVIVDHLTPPLARAESYGASRALEALIDEYYEAARLDPRRLEPIASEILSICRASGLDEDLGIARDTETRQALYLLDRHLCELKEMQIRDGLHVFGESPVGGLLDSLLVALARLPRGKGEGGDASLLRALSSDLDLRFDPLDCDPAEPWDAPKPKALMDPTLNVEGPWRTAGDAVERLEALALALVAGRIAAKKSWARTRDVLGEIENVLRPKIAESGGRETVGLLAALSGRFVAPGPSGAPSRGRPEVLPTGRNFYSVDVRGLPTPSAWTLGWKSASLLALRHAQETGDWPKSLALSAWGTANMRTGGDDIAQALALIGAKPAWDPATGRVTGFEILPLSVLDRPRIDVTLRISGFFRDAFPNLIALFDSASRAVAKLDEPLDGNPLAARFKADRARLESEGAGAKDSERLAGVSIFGSKPGAYGAGLQALIDERGWDNETDLARAYVAWGGYAYGAGSEGEARHALFERRLSGVEAVVQNQDNREHDLLDSDDYYQFEGGLAVAVKAASGKKPSVYHADHSRPEKPAIRTLEEEIARVVRARAANPKWIAGVMRHGYKGGFEMAATVDYLFAFAATARSVKDHHFDQLFSAYLMDAKVREFLRERNPAALREMTERFREAMTRGLWTPRLNSVAELIGEILG